MSVAGYTNSETIIDLRDYTNMEDMKTELERNLNILDKYADDNQVSIDTGNKRLTERQLREFEGMLAEHGLHLKELKNSSSSGQSGVSGKMKLSPTDRDLLEPGETVLIHRHLRSGQKFYSRGNVVILGDINPGAEVIAGGNILVMGALKGMAHAGALGDENSVVAAFRLSPIQLRIANHITRPPDGDKIVIDNPELARIRAGKVVIEKLKI